MKNDIGFIYSSTYNGRIKNLNPKFEHELKPSTLTKESHDFHKITENNIISTSGEQPLLLFRKKEPKVSHSFDYKMTKKNSDKNIYISDGGLKSKNAKFNSGYNYTNTNQNHKQIKSLRTYLESINVNKLLKTPALKNKKQAKTNTINSKKNFPIEEHIFYKTMRGSSNRPAFQKKFIINDKNNLHTSEGFAIRAKIEMKNKNNKLKNINKFEESKKTEDYKNELKNYLINGAIKNNFFIIPKKENNKINPNEILAQKRKDYLERNGIGVSDVNLDEENEKQNNEIKKMSKTANNFNHVKINNYTKISNGFSPKQKNYYMTLNNETHFNNNTSKNRKQNKPIVDQFEYIKKINKHKRLGTHENLSKKDRDNLYLKNHKNDNKPNLNDSFRHKNKTIPSETQNLNKKNLTEKEKLYLQKNKKNDNPSSLIDVNNDEWPYAHKRSYRSPKELNKFVKEKKIKNKQKLNNDQLLKNTILFNKFKNLYNLNCQRMNNNNNQNNQEKTIDKTIDKNNEKKNTIKIILSNKPAKIRNNISSGVKKRKEANEYYVGGDSFVNNNSTLIDPNEYYLNVLESQQLLVNSGLNKIENESDEETDELSDINQKNNNNENDNNQEIKEDLNNSKEQIKNIIKKESKRKNNKNANNINNINNNLIISKNFGKTNNNNNNYKNNNKIINIKQDKSKLKAINPKDVFKFVEVIKFLIQRKIFILLYKSYINQAINQHYNIAFTYFIAVCKYKTFRKIEEYSNYKTYNKLFRKLLLPFIKRSFTQFINNIYFKRKLEFLIILLTKFFKFKIMEKIFIYATIVGVKNEEEKFELAIYKIMKTLFKPHLQFYFDILKNYNPKKNSITPRKENEKEIKNEEQKMEEKYKKINKRYLEYSPTHNNKAKSYLYESFSDESFSVKRPRSLDSDKWDEIETKMKLLKYKIMNNDYEDEEYNDDKIDYDKYKKFNYPQNNSFNSKSEKSLNISNEKKNKNKKETLINNLKYDNGINKINQNEKNEKINKFKNEEINQININNNKGDKKEEQSENNININMNNNKDKINENKNNIKKKEKKNDNIDNQIGKNVENINNNDIANKSNNNSNNENNKVKNKNIDKNVIKTFEEDKKDEKKEDDKRKEDNKIKKNNKADNNKTKIEEKTKNNKNNYNIIDDQKNEKSQNPIEKNKKLLNNKTLSEIDISAERDNENTIDWEYDLELTNSKNKLQESTNSENLEKEVPRQEDIVIQNKLNIKEEKIFNKDKDNKETKNSKLEKDDDLKEKNEIEFKKDEIIDDEIESEDQKENDKKNNKPANEVTLKKSLKKDKKTLNESEDEYLEEFEDIDVNSETDSDFEKQNTKKIKLQRENEKIKKKEAEKEESEKEKKTENNKDKNDKSRNINIEINIKDNNNKENENQLNKPTSSKIPLSDICNKIVNIENFSNDLTGEILKNLLSSEISSDKIKLIPHKSFKYELFANLSGSQSLSASAGSSGNNLNREIGLLGLNQLSLSDDLSSLSDSIMSSYSAFSVFNRTVKDKKKEHSLYLYYRKIAPRLIKLIKEEIYLKYPRIYKNISIPLKNKSVGLMMSLSLQDADMLRDNYKCSLMEESIKNIIDKEKILKKFEPINKQIRNKDNLTSDNFYDNILNECLVDTAIELINKERLYGENGDPLAWSSRTHELVFKYKRDDPKKLAEYVCNNILKTLHSRIGLITENYDHLNAEQINMERDKRLIDNIKNELDEDEYQWRNLEMEETQLKVEIADLIMDQLYNENIEILEHIQFSRNRPDLYQNKSIYACEEIPKLSFQQTTTENALKDKDDGDEVINV